MGSANGVSNGLSGERKFRFFEELIEEDDELPHDGGERDFLGFSGGNEALVKRLEYRIKPSRHCRGHIEHPTDFDPSAADRSSASVHAAVPIIRCHSRRADGVRPSIVVFVSFGRDRANGVSSQWGQAADC